MEFLWGLQEEYLLANHHWFVIGVRDMSFSVLDRAMLRKVLILSKEDFHTRSTPSREMLGLLI